MPNPDDTPLRSATTADRREEVLTRLHEATRELVRASDRERIGEIVIETATDVLGLGIAVFSLVDPDDEVLRPLVVSEEASARLPMVTDLSYGPGTLPWTVFESGAPSVYADIGKRLPEIDDSVGTAILVPLDGHGLLAVGSSDERELTTADVEFTRLLAANAQSALDRTEREATLREERDRITTLFQNASDAMVEIEYLSDGTPTINAVNPAFENTFGFDAESVVGRSLYDVVVPAEDRGTAREHVELARRGTQFEREVRRQTADGLRDFLLRGVPLDDEKAPTVGYAIYTDITERTEQERELRRRERELARQNERLDAFASVVSHDLRNPLSVARGYLDLLAKHRADTPGGQDDTEAEYLDRIRTAHDRIDRLIGDLLTLARQGESVGETEVVSLADVARTAWQTVGTGEASLSVVTDRRFRADRDRLCELFENLFRNAISHAGADATVTVEPCEDGFAVADDGPGVPVGEREHVFERGYTTSEGGTGFGLAIVAEIAEAHGWSISVSEGDSGGARFVVRGVESVSDDV